MALLHVTYGKGRVRVMRIARDDPRHEPRELDVQVMLEGDFNRSFSHGDNTTVVATDTIKNMVYIVARENVSASNEAYCLALAQRFFDRYPQVATATVTARETRWRRLDVAGKPHDHSFLLDSNGKPSVKLVMTRAGVVTSSGIEGFTFMKTTASGWENYVMDDFTTLPETADRIAATSMNAVWLWRSVPADCESANAKILDTALEVFATTYSKGLQDSLYRMGEAVLAAVPEVDKMTMACPNKHYIAFDLARFGLDNNNQVFVATDEPHGQIECTVERGG